MHEMREHHVAYELLCFAAQSSGRSSWAFIRVSPKGSPSMDVLRGVLLRSSALRDARHLALIGGRFYLGPTAFLYSRLSRASDKRKNNQTIATIQCHAVLPQERVSPRQQRHRSSSFILHLYLYHTFLYLASIL